MRGPARASDHLLLNLAWVALACVVLVGTFLLPTNDAAQRVAATGLSTNAATATAGIPATAGQTTKDERARSAPVLDAYRGLASWVDIYDDRAWADPDAAVRDMANHGVRTLFVETGSSKSKTAVFDPQGQAAFISAAHARGMKVVAWYLPYLQDLRSDYDRIAQAVRFATPDGQRFDSFALDIESDAVTSVQTRNRALDTLSHKLRRLVGPSYPLGAIIPSPVGIAKKAGYWNDFPYASVAGTYDVFVPMGYYTYHGTGAGAAATDALDNARILRAQPGCAKVPIHLIGGLAEKSTLAEVASFAAATRKSGCIGASLYGWAGTTAAHWEALKAVPSRTLGP